MIEICAPLHVAIQVQDLAAAEAFYGNVLGLQAVERPLNFPGCWYQVGAFQIHLIVAGRVGEPSGPASPPGEKWGRRPHLAFSISNLDQARQHLQASAIPMQASTSGRAALFIQDPDGNIIELSQAPGPV
jgi:catechol 2,3-dioxygenase-like lactoylglutathione lyase family enzyme